MASIRLRLKTTADTVEIGIEIAIEIEIV